MNGCLNNNGGCTHRCIDSYGQVFCLCPDGYTLDNKDWKTCRDINECEDPKTFGINCSNETQECTNTIGGAHCRCKDGFEKEENGDKEAKCVDINECEGNRYTHCRCILDFIIWFLPLT